MKHKLIIRFLLIVIFNFSILTASSQCAKYDCLIIESILKEEIVQQYFHISSFDGDFILVIDSCNYFKSCKISEINTKEVRFSSDKRFNVGEQVQVEIFDIEKRRNKYKIYLGQEYTGKYGFVVLRKIKGRYVLKKHQLGQT